MKGILTMNRAWKPFTSLLSNNSIAVADSLRTLKILYSFKYIDKNKKYSYNK